MKTRKTSLIILLFFAILSSCNKTEIPDATTGIDKLKIPDGFTFETTKEIEVSVLFPESISFTENKSRVDVYSDVPNMGGALLMSTSVLANGQATIKVLVPAYLEQLFVQSIAGSALVNLGTLGAKDGPIVIDFGLDFGFEPPTILDGKKQQSAVQNQMPFTYKSGNAVVNLITNGDFSVSNFGLIPDWSSPMSIDNKWSITSTLGVNYAKIYTESGEKMLRITPSPSRYGGVAQLISASAGDLFTLTSNIRSNGNGNNTSWLYLIPRNASGNSLAYYNIQTNNTSNQWVTKTIAATMPAGTVSVQILLWSHIYGGAIDYDNVIVTGPVTDADGDGVDDDLDEYPNDNQRAFNVYYPNSNDFGTLAFEDLWPGKGDYDFNDLILDYRYKQVLNADNKLVEFYMDYSVRAIGASLENGFGIEIPGTVASDIASVEGYKLTENYITLSANGTEANQPKAVIILFDNAFSMMSDPSGFGINTTPESTYVEPDTLQLYVRFQNPVLFSATGRAPYNPFLIVDKDRGREVHLAGKTPTNLANTAFFGTWFDNSRPEIGKYYQSLSNLPWGISLPVKFEYPIEKVLITDTYLKFGSWAESGGTSDPDWYSNTSAGYRNSTNIYTPAN